MFNAVFSESLAVYEINTEKCGRARQVTDVNIIWRMRFVCWITEATDTHTQSL